VEKTMTDVAPAGFRTICSRDEMGDNAVVPYYLPDRKLRVAIVLIGGRLYAFDDLCTCADERCPLSGGLLTATTIICQCHGSRFDVATGAVLDGPATKALDIYEVREADGLVQVRA
jgi:3-phenylpropionate/trans-cinnamate dioxygenase ferredoxin subunit